MQNMPKRHFIVVNCFIYRDCLAKMQMQKPHLPLAKTARPYGCLNNRSLSLEVLFKNGFLGE